MAIQLPAAPNNFYTPSLNTLKSVLETQNGSSIGRIALLTAAPASIEAAWNDVGVAWDTSSGANRGNLVVGHADIGAITGPMLGPIESGGEAGYKLQFAEVKDIPVYINGSGTSTAKVIGIALVRGVDSFALGIHDDLKYIIKVDELTVTDGKLITLPEFEIIINYSEIDTGL